MDKLNDAKLPNVLIFSEKWVGPNNGITSFDNIALAMLTVFQVLQLKAYTHKQAPNCLVTKLR
jgi:hypothetical protein